MTRKTRSCPLCFRPSTSTIAGACCAGCSNDNRRAWAIRIAQGDEADRIIELAVIEAAGEFYVCDWTQTVGDGLTEPVEKVDAGFSAHASQADAKTAARWHQSQGRCAEVAGPFPWRQDDDESSDGPTPPSVENDDGWREFLSIWRRNVP